MKPQVTKGCPLCEIANTCLLGEAAWKPAVWWGQGRRRNSVLHCVLGGIWNHITYMDPMLVLDG